MEPTQPLDPASDLEPTQRLDGAAGRTSAPRGLLLLTRVLALAVFVLLASQAVSAGSVVGAFYAEGGVPEWASLLHEVGANAAFGLLALEGVAVLATPLRRRRRQLLSGLLLAVVLTGTIGLGYLGGTGIAVHVPLAVAAIVIGWVHLVAAWHRVPSPATADAS